MPTGARHVAIKLECRSGGDGRCAGCGGSGAVERDRRRCREKRGADAERNVGERKGTRRGSELSALRERLTRRTRGPLVIGVVGPDRDPPAMLGRREAGAVIARLPRVHVRQKGLDDERERGERSGDRSAVCAKRLHATYDGPADSRRHPPPQHAT